MAAKKKTKTEDQKYGEYAKELDQILSGIEEGEIDIDDLSEKAEKASELIKKCREKLNATRDPRPEGRCDAGGRGRRR